jgi:hypothetical protein
MAPERIADVARLRAACFVETTLDRAIPEIGAGRLFEGAGSIGVAEEDDVARLLQQCQDIFGSPGGLRYQQCPGKQD